MGECAVGCELEVEARICARRGDDLRGKVEVRRERA